MSRLIAPVPWSPFNTRDLIRAEECAALDAPAPDEIGGGSVGYRINGYRQAMVGPGSSAPVPLIWSGEGGNIQELIRQFFLVRSWQITGQIHHLASTKYFRLSDAGSTLVGMSISDAGSISVDFETLTVYGDPSVGLSPAAPPQNFGASAIIPLTTTIGEGDDETQRTYGSVEFNGVAFDPWRNQFFLRIAASAVLLASTAVELEDDEDIPDSAFGYSFDIGTDVASDSGEEPSASSLFGRSSGLKANPAPTLNWPGVIRPYSPGYNPVDNDAAWRKVSTINFDDRYSLYQYATNTKNSADFPAHGDVISDGLSLDIRPASYW